MGRTGKKKKRIKPPQERRRKRINNLRLFGTWSIRELELSPNVAERATPFAHALRQQLIAPSAQTDFTFVTLSAITAECISLCNGANYAIFTIRSRSGSAFPKPTLSASSKAKI